MSAPQVKVGVVGCGNISGAYFKAGRRFEILDITACADLAREKAEARAAEFGVPTVCTVDEMLADPEIEIILNLTIPKAHGAVALAALDAGKSVYNEKPLAVTRKEGQRMLAVAREKGLRVGSAPDTFLGAAFQTCRKLIDEGAIGRPIAVTAFMLSRGHESWHPDPAFYYQAGGGPMFDMGPYYLTALVSLIGPVRRVTGSARISFAERTITSQPRHGERITVETPTHIAGVMDFTCGAIGTLVTSFDVWSAEVPKIEIYGSEGTLSVPDPNAFGGPVGLRRATEKEWTQVPFEHDYADQSRGLGLADMAHAIRSGRAHRASGEMAYHVLDIMHAFHDASDAGRHLELASTCERPAPLPVGLVPDVLDD